MSRLAPFSAFTVATFALMASIAGWLAIHGFVSGAALDLWGRAAAARAGEMGAHEAALAFPPAPFALAWLTQALTSTDGFVGPGLAAALVAALIAALWFSSFLASGFAAGEALLLVTLLIANPLFLRLVTAGPTQALVILAAWWFARAAYRLRARSNVADMMALSGALVALALADGVGLMLAVSVAPFLVVFLRERLLRESIAGAWLTIVFPTLAIFAGVGFVALIFTGDALEPLRALAASSASVSHDMRSNDAMAGLLAAACCIFAAAPALAASGLAAMRRATRYAPTLGLVCALAVCAVLLEAFDIARDPLALGGPALAFSAAAIAVWPREAGRLMPIAMLLVGGFVGGACCLVSFRSIETTQWIRAMAGAPAARQHSDLALAEFLVGRDGVALDALAAPKVRAALGNNGRLIAPGGEAFEKMRMTRRTEAAWIVVRDAERPNARRDAVHEIFPELYARGAENYTRGYDRDGWRVYRRNAAHSTRP